VPEGGEKIGTDSFPLSRSLRILGVDPGMSATGFGVVEVEKNGSIRYCGSGVIRPPSQQPFPQRLWKIFCDLRQQIEIFRPHFMGVERPFFGKNVQSAMMLGQARGVAVLAGAEAGLKVQEYSPLEVKQSVVGYGRAAKEQVQAMVQALLQTPTRMAADAADALAVAICVGHSVNWQRCLDVSAEKARTDREPRRRRNRSVPTGVDE